MLLVNSSRPVNSGVSPYLLQHWICLMKRDADQINLRFKFMEEIDAQNVQDKIDSEIKLGGTTQATAKEAAAVLLSLNKGFCIPNKTQRRNLLIAFAEKGFVLYGKAFDMVRCDMGINYDDIDEIRKNMNKLVIYEIKSTNKKSVKPNFSGYFFSISTAELLTAQNLGERYRFAFVNTLSKTYVDMSLKDIFIKARGIYPTWSVQF
jgi:hypothetical protein